MSEATPFPRHNTAIVQVQRAANSETWVNEQIGFKEDPAAGIRPPEVNEEGDFTEVRLVFLEEVDVDTILTYIYTSALHHFS